MFVDRLLAEEIEGTPAESGKYGKSQNGMDYNCQ